MRLTHSNTRCIEQGQNDKGPGHRRCTEGVNNGYIGAISAIAKRNSTLGDVCTNISIVRCLPLSSDAIMTRLQVRAQCYPDRDKAPNHVGFESEYANKMGGAPDKIEAVSLVEPVNSRKMVLCLRVASPCDLTNPH